jgi:cytochrome c553
MSWNDKSWRDAAVEYREQHKQPHNLSGTFQDMCRQAHVLKARERQKISAPPQHGAPQTTVEALMLGLRERGTKAPEESAVKRRLSQLSDQQMIEVGNRVQQLKPEIARAWSATEVEILFQTRVKK